MGTNPAEEPLVQVRVLGPVELLVDGQRSPLGSRKERSVLAILAMEVNHLVPIDTLMHRLWGDQLPAKARRNLYTYKTRLRAHLADATGGEVRISTRSHGYMLEADPDSIDLHRFRRLRDQGVSLLESDMPHDAADLLDQAVLLWQPDPLADLNGWWAEETRAHLHEERVAAMHHRFDAHLRLGHYRDVVNELTFLVEHQPFDEHLIGQLMRALHGSGRTQQALEVYLRERKRFRDELGSDPGQALQELHRQMLSGEYEASRAQTGSASAPNNLLRDVSDFTGRDQEIADILAGLPDPDADGTAPVLIISGMSGVGKTALATHVAHQLADRFPEGQLYLNLHAHDPQHERLEPADALYSLLQLLDVPAGRIPIEIEPRASLWRSQMAHRSAIVLLDNAGGYEHIRHLLPGAGGCLVIVTSRRRLAGLDESQSLSLDVLPEEDSARLLARIVDDARTTDAESTARLANLCGGLPLAIRITAGRLKNHPNITVADLTERMTRRNELLKELHVGDRAMRTAFETSYRALTTAQRRGFRRLSLHFGDEVTLDAAAQLLGVSHTQAENLLDELIEQNLIDETNRGRYRFHDLMREYARECAQAEDAESTRRASQGRLSTYYLALAQRADGQLRPHLHQDDPHLATWTPVIANADEARQRLELEISGILGAARQCYIEVPMLAHYIAHFLDISGRWNDARQVHSKALEAWRARGDMKGEAKALLDLAAIQIRTSEFSAAIRSCTESLRLHREIEDSEGEADAHDRIGIALWHATKYDDALHHLAVSLDICRQINHRHGEAEALMHGGFVLWQRGNYAACLTRFRSALAIFRAMNDHRGESEVLIALGEVMRRLGRYEEALAFYTEARSLVEETNEIRNKAILIENIAGIRYSQGKIDDALNDYRKALALYRDIRDLPDEIDVMDSIGVVLKAQGRMNEALIHHQNSLALAVEIGERLKQGRALRHIGDIELDMKRFGDALSHFHNALECADEASGDPYELGCSYLGAGDALQHVQGHGAARPYWQKAVDYLRPLKVPEGNAAEARLSQPGATGT